MMRIEYDQRADALYLNISDNEIAETRPVSEYCNVDVDQEGKIVGIELLFASKTGVLRQEEITQPIQVQLAS
jgi:uncharacterized protein YuzE